MDKGLRALLVRKAEQWASKHYQCADIVGYVAAKTPARFADATLIWDVELEVPTLDSLIRVEVHLDDDGNLQVVA